MKFRWVLAAGLAAAAVATSVLAQSDPIATRMASPQSGQVQSLISVRSVPWSCA